MKKLQCENWTPIQDEWKTRLNNNERQTMAFTIKRLNMECEKNCEDYPVCTHARDELALLLARNLDNTYKKPQRFNDERFLFSDDR